MKRALSTLSLATSLGLLTPFAYANAPYSGSAFPMPGTIEAENYDYGGQNTAYYDNSGGNTGGSYRSDDVDLGGATSGYSIGWFDPGEWVEYTIDLSQTGDYEIKASTASDAGGGSYHVEFYGPTQVITSTGSVPHTNSWSTYQDSSTVTATLSAGTYVMRFAQISGGYNVDTITMSLVGGSSSSSSTSSTSSSSSTSSTSSSGGGNTPYNGVISIPGKIEAENYDVGAFSDSTAGNAGGDYRADDVDIEANASASNGHNVGWTAVDEYLEYSIDVASAGNYTINATVASNVGGGNLDLSFSGATAVNTNTLTTGYTGGWSTWSLSTSDTVSLNAGLHTLRVTMGDGFNLDTINIVAESASGAPNFPGYTLRLEDDFSSFNDTVWRKGDGAVGTESMCRFQPESVTTSGGNLQLKVENVYVPSGWSDDHQATKPAYDYRCGELRLQPSHKIKYGRFVTRMKAPARVNATGYIGSLFTYRNDGEWEELDIEVEGGRPDKMQSNYIYGLNTYNWGETRNWGAWEIKHNTGPVDAWNTWEIEWAPNYVKWYQNGTLIRTINPDDIDCNPCVSPQVNATPIPDNITYLMANFWIPNDAIQDVFGGNKYGNVYPMTIEYDYMYLYEMESHPWTDPGWQ